MMINNHALTIAKNLAIVKNNIADYEQKYRREKNSVHLLAASKGQSVEKIVAAYDAGQHSFGESYLQEALDKMALLADKSIEWHFIGHIQSNKTRKIAENFAWVHSLDNMKIAKRLNDQRPKHLPALNVCIEVNVSNQTTKSGVHIETAMLLAKYCLTLPQLKLRGLMTIPELQKTIANQRSEFHKLFSLFRQMRAQGMALDTLSMGMSDDFEAAIAEGSTLVRIGTGIFGTRC